MLGEGRETDGLEAPKYYRKSDLVAMLARLAIERPKRATKEAVVRCFKKNLQEIKARRDEIADVIEEVRRRKAASQEERKKAIMAKASRKRKVAATAGEKKTKTEGQVKPSGGHSVEGSAQLQGVVQPREAPTSHLPPQPRPAVPRQCPQKEVLVGGKPAEVDWVALETEGSRKGLKRGNSMKQTKTVQGKVTEKEEHRAVGFLMAYGRTIYICVSVVIVAVLVLHSLHRIEMKKQMLQAEQVPVWEKIKENLSFGDHEQAKAKEQRAKAEQERERREQERIAKEKAEQERERREQERIAKEKAEHEQREREQREQERIAKEKAEHEQREREQREQDQTEPAVTPAASSTPKVTSFGASGLLEPSVYLKIWNGFKAVLRIMITLVAILLASLVVLGFVLYLLHLRYKRSVKIQNYSNYLRNNICKRARHNLPVPTIKELRAQFPALSALEWRAVSKQVALDSNIRESVVLREGKEEKAWMWVAYPQ